MSFSNLTSNWRRFTSYEITDLHPDSDSYAGGTIFKASYNQGAPRFHTLDNSLIEIIALSIPWTIVGAFIMFLIMMFGGVLLVFFVSDVTMSYLKSSYGWLFLCIGLIAGYLIGFKHCIKDLMTAQAQRTYKRYSSLDQIPDLSLLYRNTLNRDCVVHTPSFLKLLFGRDPELR
jgi:hypothetical protein